MDKEHKVNNSCSQLSPLKQWSGIWETDKHEQYWSYHESHARKFQNDFTASHENYCVMLFSVVNAISKHKIKLYVGGNANAGKKYVLQGTECMNMLAT